MLPVGDLRYICDLSLAALRLKPVLGILGKAGEFNPNNNDWQLWQQHSHPIELSKQDMAIQRLNYVHNNPVAAGFVAEALHWLWSSAYDYSGGKGQIELVLMY